MSNSKKKKSTKKYKSNKSSGGRGRRDSSYTKALRESRSIQSWLTAVFLLYMGAAFPLIMHDAYFDITLTKYRAFAIGVCCYAVMMVLAVLAETLTIGGSGGADKAAADIDTGEMKHGVFGRVRSFVRIHSITSTDIFMVLFFLANLCAFFMAEDKTAAYTGENGRRCGLQFMLLALFMYLCLARGCKQRKAVMPAILAAAAFTELIAVLQYADVDFLNLRDGLSDNIHDIYISTFGNVDIYASFLCMAVPVAVGVYMFTDKLYVRICSGIAIVLGMCAVIVTNAELAYAGVGAAAVAAALIAAHHGKLERFFEAGVLAVLGVTFAGVIAKSSEGGGADLEGFSRMALHTGACVCVLAVCAVLRTAICLYDVMANKRNSSEEHSDSMNKVAFSQRFCGGRALASLTIIVVLCLIGVVTYGVRAGWSVFRFDETWGTYRGYVWSRIIDIYKDLSLPRKIFGNGNESVLALMNDRYYDEMMSKVGVVYDNAHNEYLQYLVTTGFFGAFSYIGLVASAAACAVRGIGKNAALAPVALGIIGYAAQAVFNLNQCLTTPYIFLLAALAAGLSRDYISRV